MSNHVNDHVRPREMHFGRLFAKFRPKFLSELRETVFGAKQQRETRHLDFFLHFFSIVVVKHDVC